MGEVVKLPVRPRTPERFEMRKTYAEFGRLSLSMVKSQTESPALALVLDGLGPKMGTEILGRYADDEDGRAACDVTARAATLTLTQTFYTDDIDTET